MITTTVTTIPTATSAPTTPQILSGRFGGADGTAAPTAILPAFSRCQSASSSTDAPFGPAGAT